MAKALIPQADLIKRIGAIGKASARLTRDIQEAAVNAIGYSIIHGDITIGQRLYELSVRLFAVNPLFHSSKSMDNFAGRLAKRILYFTRSKAFISIMTTSWVCPGKKPRKKQLFLILMLPIWSLN